MTDSGKDSACDPNKREHPGWELGAEFSLGGECVFSSVGGFSLLEAWITRSDIPNIWLSDSTLSLFSWLAPGCKERGAAASGFVLSGWSPVPVFVKSGEQDPKEAATGSLRRLGRVSPGRDGWSTRGCVTQQQMATSLLNSCRGVSAVEEKE